ncbi:MAG TPA: T9SS type A sorting domain-containing protein [Flavobacterium sp.]|nr:T9SS type A sorting domain-containing protein [Flavobacterium sp.]
MKKIIILLVFTTFFKGYTQCPTPSNLIYSTVNTQDALLSWTENGTATEWDVTVVPDFYVGSPLPTDSYYVSSTNSFIFANFPQTGCNVFFVRSRCSATEVSSWTALATSGCDTNVTNYLAATLSTIDFSLKNNFKIFPNPSSNILFIDNFENQIKKIEFFDLQGRIIKTINENKSEYQIDISNLLATTYIIKLSTETGSETVRFIKN